MGSTACKPQSVARESRNESHESGKRPLASGTATRLANRLGFLLRLVAAYVCDAERYAVFCCDPLRVATLFAPGR